MQKKALDTDGICSIIEACSRAGVAELKFGSLHVSFLPKLEQAQRVVWESASAPSSSDAAHSDAIQKTNDEERLMFDEKALREQQLDEMMITDPLAYEELIASGELEDSRTATVV
jgi:hypothetical protein